MTIKLITLKSTQTLIGELDCTKDDVVVIKQPVQVIVQPSKDGSMMGFAPFLEFSNEFRKGITIPIDNILCITSPVRELENQYNKMFGVGIEIATAMPKL